MTSSYLKTKWTPETLFISQTALITKGGQCRVLKKHPSESTTLRVTAFVEFFVVRILK